MNQTSKQEGCRGVIGLLHLFANYLILTIFSGAAAAQSTTQPPPRDLSPEITKLSVPDEDSFSYIRVSEARKSFQVDGSDLAVAIVSSGINDLHRTFPRGKVLARRNFTGGDEGDVRDLVGNGSHLAATVAGKPLPHFRGGIAPGRHHHCEDPQSWWPIAGCEGE